MLDIASIFRDIRAFLSDGNHVPSVLVAEHVAQKSIPEDDMNSVIEPLLAAPESLSRRRIHGDSEQKKVTFSNQSLFPGIHIDLPEMNSLLIERNVESSYWKNLNFKSIRNKIILVGILLGSFCVHLVSREWPAMKPRINCKKDTIMFPFKVPGITDSFNSLRHIGLYAGFYRVLAGTARPFLEAAYRRWSPWIVFLLSLLSLQIGWILCGLAKHSWVFAIGRALSGIGSSGVMAVFTSLATGMQVRRKGWRSKLQNLPLNLLFVTESISTIIGPL